MSIMLQQWLEALASPLCALFRASLALSYVCATRTLYEVCKLSNETGNVALDLATPRRRDLEGRVILLFNEITDLWCSVSESTCGIPLGNQNLLEDDRVVGGYDVGYYRYPWYATLIRYNQVVCGGVLIGPRTVLTAAHCYKEFLDLSSMGYLRLESIYTVKLGVYNVCTSESSQREKPYYDICMLTLAADTSDYQPICLPKYALKKKPNEASVPGLGTLRYQGRMPCTVHEARLLIYDDKECHDMIYRTGNDPKQIKNAFCAGYLQGGTDTCQGDSGGPLQSMNKNGQYVLLGNIIFDCQVSTVHQE
ncbi:hypothetical protein NQ318_013822 [Aromia moschata]|uniref:Peptidase S1 domain-containing protein n=1 Tax=Aromia moschata TaxID=1265417 RepID=A0AAV8Z8D6_9CUCU|nr:hypothetical protein NQ318_013822 [Aromia moschata]